MLGLKLKNIVDEIYVQSLQRLNECNIPCTLQNIVMENVLSKFQDNALSAAAERAIALEKEIQDSDKDTDLDDEGEENGGHHE